MSDAEITCEILKIAVAIIGLYFIVQRLKLTEEVFKEDHDRRKKESTLTAYNVIRDSFREIHSELCSKLNIDKHTSEPITDEVVDRIVNEDSHRIKVTTLLSYIQRLAVGSQHNIYDQDVLWDLSGSSFINVYENYRPYMNRAREDNVLYYLEADEFIEYLKTRSKQKNEELRSLE